MKTDNAPDSWRVLSVAEACLRVTSGGTPSRRVASFYGAGYPWVKTKELADTWITNTEESITQDGLDHSSAKVLPANTVLMAMYGATAGKLAILRRAMTCNQAACAMVANPAITDFRYLFYQLLAARPQIVDLASGAAQQNLNALTVRSLLFPFPPLAEQTAIAATLGALDDKIESNQRLIETAKQLARAHYEQPQVRTRVKATELLAPVPGGTPQRGVPDYWDGTIPWASAKDVAASESWFVLHTAEAITADGVTNSAAKVLPAGTIVITARGTVGALARLAEPMAFNQSCYALAAADGVPDSVLFLALEDAVQRIRDLGHGTIFNTVTTATFAQLELNWPTLTPAGQQRIETLFALILTKLRETARLRALRDALLPELMSGRIRVAQVRSGRAAPRGSGRR